MDIKQLKSQYLEHLEIEKDRSQKTIENYDHYLERFFEWAKIKSPADITDDLIRSYRLYLNRMSDEKGRPLAPL